jgi:hypothetical protein
MTRTTLVGLAETENVRAKKEKKQKKDFMQRRENKFKERSKVNPSIQKEKVELGQD